MDTSALYTGSRLARARVNDAYGQEFTPKNSHRKSLAFRKDCLS